MLPSNQTTRHETAIPRLAPQGARAFRRLAAAGLPVVFFAGTALSFVVSASPASAGATTWYAYAAGAARLPVSCPKTSVPSKRCTLAEALADASAGAIVELATPGSKGHYRGNWAIDTGGTFVAQPLTIKAAPGIARPVLDGNHGKHVGCQTKTCSGPVLTIGSDVHVVLHGITIENAAGSGKGGAIENSSGGVLTVSASTFSGNSAADGGAIDNGDKGGGILVVSASTFIDNTATSDGGAIDNADKGSGALTVSGSLFSQNRAGDGGAIDDSDNGGSGAATVSGSTFHGNIVSRDGGAIDNGDKGSGTLTVSRSSFTANASHSDGGAIDNGDKGSGNLFLSTSTFSADTASVDGGAIDNADSGKGTIKVSVSTFSGNGASADGGAIDTGDRGAAAASVWESTFTGNSATGHGGTVDNSDHGGSAAIWVAANIFNGSCDQPGGAWFDEGHNTSNNPTCFNVATGQTDVTSAGTSELGPLGHHGGPTKTIEPLASSPAVGVVPNGAAATLNGSAVKLCPTTDQRGVRSASGKACNAGSVQSS
ncbi:MAG TPA: choice-of-anchor Q domain-containing protein [Acidimicrobiales bacterium]|nr:choice-of-anchor Q domain-containing protein [Acidimicrobiales bacterium]